MVVITTFQAPESPVRLQQDNVTAILDKKNLGCGTLFVSERTLSWQKVNDIGFSMDYFDISLHAVSKDPAVYNKECIYILTDSHIHMPGDGSQRSSINENNDEEEDDSNDDDDDDDDDDNDDVSEADLSELILVPENSTHVQIIYDTIKLCQELNPDPDDVDDEDENVYADAEDDMNAEAESEDQIGDAVMENLIEQLEVNSVNVDYNCSNGDANNEEEFEDAD